MSTPELLSGDVPSQQLGSSPTISGACALSTGQDLQNWGLGRPFPLPWRQAPVPGLSPSFWILSPS